LERLSDFPQNDSFKAEQDKQNPDKYHYPPDNDEK
jgi:hypothetical protein